MQQEFLTLLVGKKKGTPIKDAWDKYYAIQNELAERMKSDDYRSAYTAMDVGKKYSVVNESEAFRAAMDTISSLGHRLAERSTRGIHPGFQKEIHIKFVQELTALQSQVEQREAPCIWGSSKHHYATQ